MNELKFTISEQLQQLHMFMLRAVHRGYRRRDKRHNPFRGQGRVLSLLKLKPEISQRELTYLLDVSKQSLGELLSKLEASGLITKEQSDDDKRVMTVKLTQAGMVAADSIDEQETDMPLDCLNDDELQVFSEYLARLIKRYEEQYPDENYEERRKIRDSYMSHRRHHNHEDHRRRHGSDGHGRHRDRGHEHGRHRRHRHGGNDSSSHHFWH